MGARIKPAGPSLHSNLQLGFALEQFCDPVHESADLRAQVSVGRVHDIHRAAASNRLLGESARFNDSHKYAHGLYLLRKATPLIFEVRCRSVPKFSDSPGCRLFAFQKHCGDEQAKFLFSAEALQRPHGPRGFPSTSCPPEHSGWRTRDTPWLNASPSACAPCSPMTKWGTARACRRAGAWIDRLGPCGGRMRRRQS